MKEKAKKEYLDALHVLVCTALDNKQDPDAIHAIAFDVAKVSAVIDRIAIYEHGAVDRIEREREEAADLARARFVELFTEAS